jgi:hypothetical protein
VYDIAAEKFRDVDVTVEHPIANVVALKGIEVKKHKQPLDVTHVEQLALKFKDMPTIKAPQIVSASGYTAGAIKKAAAHGVELFKLVDWDPSRYSFPHADFSQASVFTVRQPEFLDGPHVSLTVSNGAALADADPKLFLLTNERGEPHSSGISYEEFKANVINQATHSWSQQRESSLLPVGVQKPLSIHLQFSDRPHVRCGEIVGEITAVNVEGLIQWRETRTKMDGKVLVSESTDEPLIGCVLAELPMGNLIGITASNADRTIKFINVTVSARNLRVIRDMRLERACERRSSRA